MGGVDVEFTKSFGMNVELKYVRAFTSTFDESIDQTTFNGFNNQFFTQSHDQYFIEQLGQEIDASNVFSITAGLTINF